MHTPVKQLARLWVATWNVPATGLHQSGKSSRPMLSTGGAARQRYNRPVFIASASIPCWRGWHMVLSPLNSKPPGRMVSGPNVLYSEGGMECSS